MSISDAVNKFNSRRSLSQGALEFKKPYTEDDLRLLTDGQLYIASLDAEDTLMGYGMIKIGLRLNEDRLEFQLHDVGSPLLKTQSWFRKDYSRNKINSFWMDVLEEGRIVDTHCLDFAVSIIADPRCIVLDSLEMNPDNEAILDVRYYKTNGRNMILCNGYSRLRIAQHMVKDLQHLGRPENEDYVTWVAKFYNKDKIQGHPKETELKYYLCHYED